METYKDMTLSRILLSQQELRASLIRLKLLFGMCAVFAGEMRNPLRQ
jgi:hypothetical protein